MSDNTTPTATDTAKPADVSFYARFAAFVKRLFNIK